MFNTLLTTFAADCQSSNFFGLPTWNKYLDFTRDAYGQCTLNDGFQAAHIWLIGAAILEILIRVAGFLAVVFIIYGGFKFLTSQGAPESTSAARRSILNAVAGLIITVIAATVVSFVATTLSQTNPAFCTLNDQGICRGQEVTANNQAVQSVLKVVYAIAGAVAAILVVIGGLKLTTSSGDPQRINSARNTIIYALVGLVIVLAASVITSYILSRVGGAP